MERWQMEWEHTKAEAVEDVISLEKQIRDYDQEPRPQANLGLLDYVDLLQCQLDDIREGL